MAQAELRTLLEPSVDFDALGQQSPDASSDPDRALLLLGAVDVVSGLLYWLRARWRIENMFK